MGNMINNNNNLQINQFQMNKLSQRAGQQTGIVGREGKKNTLQKEASESKEPMEMLNLSQFSNINSSNKSSDSDINNEIKSFYQKNGCTYTNFMDGCLRQDAPNGTCLQRNSSGNSILHLPNDMDLSFNAFGKESPKSPVGINKSTGENFKVWLDSENNRNNSNLLKFTDNKGNFWKVNFNNLSFKIENASKTLTQKVNTDGSMKIVSKTIAKDPKLNRVETDRIKIDISPDGKETIKIAGKNDNINRNDINIDNKQLDFKTHKDLGIELELPYPLPSEPEVLPETPLVEDPINPGQGETPQIPEDNNPQQPNIPPNLPPHQSPPGPDMPGMPPEQNIPPNPNQPNFPPGQDIPIIQPPINNPEQSPNPISGQPGIITPGPFNPNFPSFPEIPNFPGMPSFPGAPNFPGMPIYQPDPYTPNTPVRTASGMDRIIKSDGTLAIKLDNDIIMNELPNGKHVATDPRSPGKTFPVEAQQIFNEYGRPETEYNFTDSKESSYKLFGKCNSFSVLSKNQKVHQWVQPNGTMTIQVRDNNNKIHNVIVEPNGKAFSNEKGVQLNHKAITFSNNNIESTFELPYEIPQEQYLMVNTPTIGTGNMIGNIPVPNPYKPCLYPSGMYPSNSMGHITGPMGEIPIHVNNSMEEIHENENINSVKEKTGFQKFKDNIKNFFTGESSTAPPNQQPAKPSIWKRIKNVFTGEQDYPKNNQYGSPYGQPYSPYNYGCNPYPNVTQMYENNNKMLKSLKIMNGISLAASVANIGMMTIGNVMRGFSSYPMGGFYSPFNSCGNYGFGMGHGFNSGLSTLGSGLVGAGLGFGLSHLLR